MNNDTDYPVEAEIADLLVYDKSSGSRFIDEDKLKTFITASNERVRRKTIDECVEMCEKIIQKERFSGAPYALNEVIKKLKDKIK